MSSNMIRITRRRFLADSSKTIVAGSALAGLASPALARTRVAGANDKVVLALIGAGSRGTDVIRGMLKNNKNVEVKYVCDVNEARGGEAMSGLTQAQGYSPKRIN